MNCTNRDLFDDSFNDFPQIILNRRSKSKNKSKLLLTKCRNIGLSRKKSEEHLTNTNSENHIPQLNNTTNENLITTLNGTKNESLITTQQLKKLESWGLPPAIITKYEERGIKEMFDWQVECLSNIQILKDHANLVYSAPTSAGKTLVAEILAIKTVVERERKVIVILPFVSVVREKMFYFQDILGSSGIRVEGFMGSYNPPGGFKKVQVAICTIEKANNIVNRLLEVGEIEDIGAVCIDELHLLGDPNRGYLLELLLTKLLFITKKNTKLKIQLIGMSATLPNLSVLSTWLNAVLYRTDYRPIPLYEQCYVNGILCNEKFELIRKIEPHADIPKDNDNVIQFCLETIYCSCSVLIFCSTKNWCETLAQQISTTFRTLGRSESPLGACLREQLKTELIIDVLEQLKRCPVGLDSVLKATVTFGVAFHHAGLTIDERDIIECAFRNGAIRVLVATSTLSAGVNLPARRVIIRSPMFGGKPMDTLTYRQMIGRAGRMGKDTAGESILICQKNEKYTAEKLLSGNLKPIVSCLEGSGRLKRAILEVIASGVAISPADIKLFTECTLLATSDDLDEIENPIEETIHFLLRNEFIRLQKNAENELQYMATSLAKACLSSSLPPEEGLTLFAELEKARQCFVLETELHIIYLVTPYSACNQWGTIDWMLFQSLWDQLPQADRRVGELIGISESYIARAMSGRVNNNSKSHIHRRFYVALALRELVEEIPLAKVADKYKCNRGLLQSLQQSASTFAGMVTAFCKQLGWSSVELLVAQFQDRLQFGVNRELLDLMRLPSLNGISARLLFNASIETIVILASTDVCMLENILTTAVPFESEKERNCETVHEAEKRKKFKTIWISGKNGLTEREAAEMLIKEARNFLKYEMGIVEAKWDNEVTSCNLTGINENNNLDTSESKSKFDTSSKLYVTLNSISDNSSVKTSQNEENITRSSPKTYTIVEENLLSNRNDEKQEIHNQTINTEDIFESEILSPKNTNVLITEVIEPLTPPCNNANIDPKASVNNTNICATEIFESETLPLKNTRTAEIFESKSPSPNKVKTLNTKITQVEVFDEDIFESTTPSVLNQVQICAEEFAKASDYYILENNFSSISIDLKTSKTNNSSTVDAKFCDLENKLNIKLIEDTNKSLNKTVENLLNNTNQSGSLFDESMLIDSNICKILDNKIEINSCVVQTMNSTPVCDEKILKNSFLEQAFDTFSLLNNEISIQKDVVENKDIVLNSSEDLLRKFKGSFLEQAFNSFSLPNNENSLRKVSVNENNDVGSDEKMKNSFLEQAFNSFSLPNNGNSLRKSISENKDREVNTKENSLIKDISSENNHCVLNSNQRLTRKRIISENNFKLNKNSLRKDSEDDDDIVSNSNDESIGNTLQSKYLERTGKSLSKLHENTKRKLLLRSKSTKSEISDNITNKRPSKITSPIQQKKDKIETIRSSRKLRNKFDKIEIIEICKNKKLFETITKKLLLNKILSISVACEKFQKNKTEIGTRIIRYRSGLKTQKTNLNKYVVKDRQLIGIAVFAAQSNNVYYFSLIPEELVSDTQVLAFFQKLFTRDDLTIYQFDAKQQIKLLLQIKMNVNCKFLDPKIIEWLFDPESREQSLHNLIRNYRPELKELLKSAGKSKYQESISLNVESSVCGQLRSAIEALTTWYIIESQQIKIIEQKWDIEKILHVEMDTILSLARMEVTGFGINTERLDQILSLVQDKMAEIETQCYSIVGRHFSLSSSTEVAKVLKLAKTRKISTNKRVLEKLDNPIAKLVMLWRKLNSILTKSLFPVLREVDESRIYCCSDCFNATGRITMYEPSLQNIPRDFEINIKDSPTMLSVRSAFVPKDGYVLISADYCQLELRLLAHFSKDKKLCAIMHSDDDVFRLIAAKWYKLPITEVDDVIRQRAKQLCYGIIYGMGVKVLGDQMGLDENEASEFIESFKNTYPKIREFIDNTIDKCRKLGYVETLYGRRRYLEHINKSNSLKGQAERQAVNTTIQGSAADIAKTAMVNIDKTLRTQYGTKNVATLVLHLHDELIYETKITELNSVMLIIKNCMEQAVNLSVPFPVKIKYGYSWGELEVIDNVTEHYSR